MGLQSAVLGELVRRQNAGKTFSRVLLTPLCSTRVVRESEAFLTHSQACCEDGTMWGEGWGEDDGYLRAVWSLFFFFQTGLAGFENKDR